MPGYGIAQAKGGKGLLPWRWAEERLENGRTYFLSTADSTGKPHVMPVWGVWFSDAFFFSTGNQSRKSRNLSANPRCSVAMEVAYGPRPKKGQVKDAVVLEGMAELVTDVEREKNSRSSTKINMPGTWKALMSLSIVCDLKLCSV